MRSGGREMIPGKLVRFLEERANVAVSGTRDEELVPHVHRVSGWRIGKEAETITSLIPALFTPDLIEALQDNGSYAFTAEEIPTHETYQFRGQYVSHRPIESQDLSTVEEIRQRFVKGVRMMYPDVPVELLRNYVLQPDVAITFTVHEVYLQTPGPGAGSRISPPPEA